MTHMYDCFPELLRQIPIPQYGVSKGCGPSTICAIPDDVTSKTQQVGLQMIEDQALYEPNAEGISFFPHSNVRC